MEADAAPYALDLQLLLTALVAGSWWALYRPLLAQSHYRWWAWGWTAFLVFLVGARLAFTADLDHRITLLIHGPAGLLQITFFALGAETLRRGEDLPRSESRLWLGLAVVVGIVAAVIQFPHEEETLQVTARTLTRSPGLALALGFCGWQFLAGRDRTAGLGVRVTAVGFFLYAFDQAVYSVGAFQQAFAMATGTEVGQAGIGLVLSDAFVVADMVWEASIGLGAILLLVEEKDRLYRVSRRSRRQLQALFEESIDGILVASGDGRVRTANPTALDMLGHEEDGLAGRPLEDLLAGIDPDLPPTHEQVREGGGLTLETTCVTATGARFPAELSLSAYEIDGEEHLQVIMRDISTRKALIERLRHEATHHPLTDLPNRQYVFDELSRMLAMMRRGEARPGVLFLDLDRFKTVNDTYGHAVGDELLVAVAERLRESVRATELIGHLGGDEFVVLVPWCESEEDLRWIGRRVSDALSEPYELDGPRIRLTASVGGALARDESTADALLQRADGAMYRAKRRPAEDAPDVCVAPDA